MARDLPEKTCAACQRPFRWRKKWERDWDSVRFCSERCRTQRAPAPSPSDPVEAAVLALLDTRAAEATVCPSEVARALAPQDWRAQMQPVREAAARLVARGLVDVTQRGQPVNLARARGPIRLRRKKPR